MSHLAWRSITLLGASIGSTRRDRHSSGIWNGWRKRRKRFFLRTRQRSNKKTEPASPRAPFAQPVSKQEIAATSPRSSGRRKLRIADVCGFCLLLHCGVGLPLVERPHAVESHTARVLFINLQRRRKLVGHR